jgi:hypothetical protein
LRRAEGGAKILGVFRVKNHDFTPKNHIFPILGGRAKFLGYFVRKITILPKFASKDSLYFETGWETLVIGGKIVN